MRAPDDVYQYAAALLVRCEMLDFNGYLCLWAYVARLDRTQIEIHRLYPPQLCPRQAGLRRRDRFHIEIGYCTPVRTPVLRVGNANIGPSVRFRQNARVPRHTRHMGFDSSPSKPERQSGGGRFTGNRRCTHTSSVESGSLRWTKISVRNRPTGNHAGTSYHTIRSWS